MTIIILTAMLSFILYSCIKNKNLVLLQYFVSFVGIVCCAQTLINYKEFGYLRNVDFKVLIVAGVLFSITTLMYFYSKKIKKLMNIESSPQK